ncbi:NAD(P)-binding protein [Stipitochalara longipes BDJ]|nr:NAD(P)-binding protein [Stipitochalara longipes BDJ]
MTKSIPENAVWLITGCSSGLGQSLSTLLEESKSYCVVATARRLSALSYLPSSPNVLKLELDVTSQASIDAAVAAAVEKFGRINVLVNNAGYGLMGDAEGMSDAEAREIMDTNFWGAVNMTKAVLPVFRDVNLAGEGGVVVMVSSMGGFIGFPGSTYYHASKFAMEGFTESVSKEMLPEWNIRFLILEPGGVKTGYASGMRYSKRHPAYLDPRGPTNQLIAYIQTPGVQDAWGEAELVVKALVKVVASGDIPFRLPMGSDAWGLMKAEVQNIDKELEKWKLVSESSSSREQMQSVEFLKK